MKAPARYYPPEMLVALASEREDPYTVAAMYGYKASDFDRIRKTPSFEKALSAAKETMASSGLSADVAGYSMLQEFSMSVAEDLFLQYHNRNTPVDAKVRIASVLFTREAQLRDRVQPKGKEVQSNGVRIVINIPSAPSDDRHNGPRASFDDLMVLDAV